jgi:hypothetical protein
VTGARPAAAPTYPAVAEADARGATAALYAEIRQALGVPVVNLIWRHLATLPGGLEWAWGAVEPLYRSGAAAREGAALLRALPLPDTPGWSRAEVRGAAVDEAAARTVLRVLDSYNRSNAMNLVALTALAGGLRGERAAPPGPAAAVAPADGGPPVDGALPALLTPAQMTAATAALVARLDRLGEMGEGRIPASMYRHLAHWPGFLALAAERIAPLHDDGRLAGLIAAARDLARAAAERVAGALAAPGSPPTPPIRAAVPAALTEFTGTVIAKMVPICALLRRAMPE